MPTINFGNYLKSRRDRINHALDQYLPAATLAPQRLHEAMRYAVLNGGKRMRPLLVYTVGEIFNADLNLLDIPAATIELVHAFSLIHDDLPGMDNDDFRRGKLSCHKAFDEATAILAGDALLVLAFQLLSSNNSTNPQTRVDMINALTTASGSVGMAGGQAIDMENTKLTIAQLEQMYILKTGALLSASAQLGALAAGVSHDLLPLLDRYACCLGLAFQIQDDLFDLEEIEQKITYPALVGVKKSQQRIKELHTEIAEILGRIPNSKRLSELTNYIIQRTV